MSTRKPKGTEGPTPDPETVAQLAELGYPVDTRDQIVDAAMAAHGLPYKEALNLLYGAPPQIVPGLPRDLRPVDSERSD